MKRILYSVIAIWLLSIPHLSAQIDTIITPSGELGGLGGDFEFVYESGAIVSFPRLTYAGEILYYPPLVTTDSVPVTMVSCTSFTVYANIVFNGWLDEVTDQGFQICPVLDFSTGVQTVSVAPDNDYAFCEVPCNHNSYHYTFTGLSSGTTYYVRSYATNSSGTSYGAVVTVTTAAYLPTVTTNVDGNNVTATLAIITSNVTSDGCSAVTARGVCWGTVAGPTLSGSHTEDGAGTGSFSSTLTGLTPNTTYYVRPYAINGVGTNYGNEITFTTPCWVVTVEISGETYICAGESITLTASGATTYEWSKGSATTTIGTGATLTVNTGGTYYVIGTDTYGCEGSASKTVTVHVPQHGSEAQSICGSDLPYSWHGVVCPSAGDYTYSHSDNNGCTQVDTLHLTVDYGTHNVIIETACESFTWHGTTYTTSGTYTYEYDNVDGCPSVDTLHLTITSCETSPTPCAVPTTHPAQTGSAYQGNGYQGANHGLETVNADGEITSVTDYDGNEYPVVRIGSQCWLAENMRCTHSPSTGTYIVNNQFTSGTSIAETYTGKMARWYNNDSATYASKHYGLLYNWNAAVDVYNTSYGELSINADPTKVVSQTFTGDRQGICPRGWHVPTDAEWNAVEAFLCGSDWDASYETTWGFRGTHAGKLATGDNWTSSTIPGAPGDYNTTQRGSSGFAALPAGYCYSAFDHDGDLVSFWASSQTGGGGGYSRDLNYNSAGVSRTYHRKSFGFSVRCLRDGSGNGGSTVQAPTVTTGTATNITENSATLSGSVTNPDNVTIASRGFEYKAPGSTAYTTVAATGTDDSFTAVVSNLAPSTEYTYRAFVTTATDSIFGSELTFTTSAASTPVVTSSIPCTIPAAHPAQTGSAYQDNGYQGANHGIETVNADGKINSVTDYDGNEYPVVQIGSQCWLAENMRCTHSPKTGHRIVGSPMISYGSKLASWYSGNVTMNGNAVTLDSATCVAHHFGLLYNWCAAMDTANPVNYREVATSTSNNNNSWSYVPVGRQQGVCPMGWHVPTDAEWSIMEGVVNGSDISSSINYRGSNGGMLTGGDDWNSSTVSGAAGDYANTLRNSSGFSTVPAGRFYNLTFSSAGIHTNFWSSSEYGSDIQWAWNRFLNYNYAGMGRHYDASKACGFSVRCLRDETSSTAQDPTVTTSPATNVTETTATLNGTITNPDNVEITAKGFEWKATVGGTYSAVNATGEAMTYNLAGLTPNTGYTYKAFITYGGNTVYGNEVTFTTPEHTTFTCGTSTVTDYEGNVYHTVSIGNQCWTKENMRCTISPKGHLTPGGDNSSSYVAYYYDITTSPIPLEERGYLYNWAGAMDTTATAEITESFNRRRGICPEGWHVPSDREWDLLVVYLSGQSQYWCGNNSNYVIKALASKDYWNSSTIACAVGNDTASNNATGFSALPVGCRETSFGYIGSDADFHSSTSSGGNYAYRWSLLANKAVMDRMSTFKSHGRSVRCVSDDSETPTAIYMNPTGNETLTTCNVVIYDDGGPMNNYGAYCNSTMVIYPENANQGVAITGTCDLNEDIYYQSHLYFYDGENTNAPLVAEFTHDADIAVAVSGPMTIRFTSSAYTAPGFVLNVSCTSCPPPANVQVSEVGENTATVSWKGNADQYTVYLSGDATGSYTTTDTFYTINGLDANFDYSVQVRSSCGEESSLLSPAVAFKTSCAAVTVTVDDPWTEDFESYTGSGEQPFHCWDRPVVDVSQGSPFVYCGYSGSCHSGANSAELKGSNNMLTLPPFTNDIHELRLSFWATTYMTGYGTLEVGVMSDVTDPSTFEVVGTTPAPAPRGSSGSTGNGSFMGYYDFSNVTASSGRIALRYTSTMSNNSWNLDDFVVELIPGGPSVTNPTVVSNDATNVTETTATLNGTITNPDNVVITAKGFEWKATVGGTYTSVNATGEAMTYNLTGLTPKTGYTYKAFITYGGNTVYGEEVTFTTPCWTVDVSITGETSICSGESTTLTASGATTYEWTKGSSTTVIGTDATLNVSTSGAYYVTGYDGYHCSGSASKTVTVHAPQHTSLTKSSCVSYAWERTNGSDTTIFDSGTYIYRYQNGYGCGLNVDTLHVTINSCVPVVSTLNPVNVAQSAVTLKGYIGTTYSATVVSSGFEWKLTDGGTYSRVYDAPQGGDLQYVLSGLQYATSYTYRAFVETQYGTGYGNEVLFTTLEPVPVDGEPCPYHETVTDIDNNVYNTVQIGEQCWMKENLKTTHYADGAAISLNGLTTQGARYYPGDNSSNVGLYGYLYDWYAVMNGASPSAANPSGIQGICPEGWHVPSYAEWTQLSNYVGSKSQYICDNDASYIAKALAADEYWYTNTGTGVGYQCSPGYSLSGNNATGFSALPAGFRYYSNDGFQEFGSGAEFWTTTSNSDGMYYFSLYFAFPAPFSLTHNAPTSCSVRCLFGKGAVLSSVTTADVSDITTTSALSGGVVISDGGVNATRGVQCSTSEYFSEYTTHASGSGIGEFTVSLTGLTPHTTYYVRAYSTNQAGTSYGVVKTFTTEGNYPSLANCTVTDITTTGATFNGEVVSGNQLAVTSRGFHVSTSSDFSNYSTYSEGSGTGSFSSIATNLAPHTTYYVRAYATNAVGTTYSPVVSFITAGNYPTMATACTVTNVTTVGATFNGEVLSENLLPVTSRGFHVSTNSNFSSYSTYTSGEGTGTFNITATDLISNTTYYVRAYATNAAGSSSSSTVSFRVLAAPSVVTNTTPAVTTTTAVLGANITNPDNITITDRGFEWKTTNGGSYTQVSVAGTNNNYTYNLTGLTLNTSYTYRAYITYNDITVYGSPVVFVTLLEDFICGSSTVKDYDNNTYNTLQLGSQCWMASNLRTVHYADGTFASFINPNDNSNNVPSYGYLYNWNTVMYGSASSSLNPSGVQGICPTGWHVPSSAEWNQLMNYVGSQSEYGCGGSSANIAKSLASTIGWESNTDNMCSVGNGIAGNNATGFGAMPAGYSYLSNNSNRYARFGTSANYWSATEYSVNNSPSNAYYYSLDNTSSTVATYNSGKTYGYSVRCVRNEMGDATSQTQPSVTTGNVVNLNKTSVTIKGSMINPENVAITAQGFEWRTTTGGIYTQVSASGNAMTYDLTGLTANTSYTYRAYVTTAVGTRYGTEKVFTTLSEDFICGSSAVKDYDNNTYNTLQLGSQCWMASNLRTVHYADGTFASFINPNDNSNNVPSYGYLYNWNTVMYGSASSSLNPSGVQGVCPTGWHVPSSSEWNQLMGYVGSQSEYICGGSSANIAKSLASTTGWVSNTDNVCGVGNGIAGNNATGFGAMPAGYSYPGNNSNRYARFGTSANYWSATEYSVNNSSTNAYYYSLDNTSSTVASYNSGKSNGYSVRCIRNAEGSGVATVPTVTTSATVENITPSSATVSGEVTSQGGALVTSRGICWGTAHNPTITGLHTSNGTGAGTFSGTLTGLTPNNTYYARAYATNGLGTVYGNEVSFITLCNTVTATISGDTNVCAGNSTTLTAAGGNTYKWSTGQNGNHLTVTPTDDATYTVTAYGANNCTGTATVNVHVLPLPTDYSIHVDNHVCYGDSLAVNVTPVLSGAQYIWNQPGVSTDTYSFYYSPSQDVAQEYVDNLQLTVVDEHGCQREKNVQITVYPLPRDTIFGLSAICRGDTVRLHATGQNQYSWSSPISIDQAYENSVWHVPSTTETYTLEVENSNFCRRYLTKEVSVYELPSVNINAYGVTHFCSNETYTLTAEGASTYMWSIGQSGTSVQVQPRNDTVYSVVGTDANGCVGSQSITFDVHPAYSRDTAVTVCDNELPYLWQGKSLTENGVYKDTLESVAGCDSIITLTLTITNCVPAPTYTCTAPTTHPAQTSSSYQNNGFNGANHGLETVNADGEITSVTDYDGNEYPVVQIGSQCWLAENMRCTHAPSTGTYIVNNQYTSGTSIAYTYTGKMARWYNNDSATYASKHYGLLYNWNAAVDVYNTSYGELSVNTSSNNAVPQTFTGNRQGICPRGWHVPSDDEWTSLTDYVSSQSSYQCSGNSGNIGKALASIEYWSSYSGECYPGDQSQHANNATGFAALPVGYCGQAFIDDSYQTFFWASYDNSGYASSVANRGLGYDGVGFYRGGNVKYFSCSVRCLRDETAPEPEPSVTSSKPCTVPTTHPAQTGSTYQNNGFNGANHGLETVNADGEITSVTDYDGNEYQVVQIGSQCWLAENMRCTHAPSTGTYLIPAASTGYTYTGKQARWYNNESATYAPMNYGLLYNWNAAVDTFNTAYGETSVNTSSSNAVSVTFTGHRRGICPAGWHLPSDAEWTAMEDYVGSQSAYVCGGNNIYIAKALASETGWNSSTDNCAVGNTLTANNVTGFSAVPAGTCGGSSFGSAGYSAYFWSATQSESYLDRAYFRSLNYNNASVSRYFNYKYIGFSVRCLRDENGGTAQEQPTATTSPATNLAATSATLNGTVSNPDNVTITAQGFEWKTTEGGTYAPVSATGETMTYSLTGLTASTSYTYRAFVTTASGTSYGEEVTFTTLSAGGTAVIDEKSCPEAQTVTDHEGNVYATVQIGNQCWMRDNLRTTTSPSTGTYLIPAANANYTYTGKQARWFNNDSATYAPMNYGLLYNWNAAVDTFNTAYGETSVNTSSSNAVSVTFTGRRRGICPAGWHLPSDAEWTTLTDYVSSQSEFQCGGNSNYIAKALASTEGWNTNTSNCAVGNDLTANNATGFSAVPAGQCSGSSFYGAGDGAYFWSSAHLESNYAYDRGLDYGNARVGRYGDGKNYGRSVRCLRDESGNTAQAPTVTTGTATNITENSATLSGSVTNPDNVTIASKGFEYKALGSTANTQVAATGTDDSFSATVSNLAPSTEYSYRAFVTYDNNTVYGGEVTFTTLCGNVQLSIQATKTSICPGVESVTLTASGAETYTWSTNETGASITITAPGHYTVVGQDANGCEGFTDIYIYEEVCAPVPQVATLEPTHDPELYYHYLSGQIVSDNGSAVTECGFCISDGDQEPTYPNSAMSVQNWTGNTFNKNLHVSDFTEGVTYYVRAYARNSAGTGYGETVTIKWPKHPVVNLSDNDITNVTDNSAAATASVELRNCTGIVAAGFCWREIENNVYPTLEDSHTVEAGSTSDYSFSSAITGLTQGIEYIVRAYVTTDENLTVYSGSSYFTTKCGAPTFELSACGDDCVEVTYDLTNTGAMDGIGAYIQYKEAAASVNSWYEEYAFSSPYNISYFLPNTEYEIRVGSHCDYESVSWSESKYFTVPYGSSAPTPAVTSAIPCTITSGHPAQTAALGYTASGANHGLETVTSDGKINSVTDYDGNEYPVVQIGSQCWMAQNMRCTHAPSTGTYLIPAASTGYTHTGKQARWNNNDSATYAPMNYGLLYNWNAAVDTFNTAYGETSVNGNAVSVTFSGHRRGICPAGWHLPSDAEWNTMEATVSGSDWQTSYETGAGYRGSHAGKLAGGDNWTTGTTSGAPGDYGYTDRDVSGFSAVPAGYCDGSSFNDAGNRAYFWSSFQHAGNPTLAWYRDLSCSLAGVSRYYDIKRYGYSVRCLRD